MSCVDTINRTIFQYNVVASYNDEQMGAALYARIIAALYSQMNESRAED
ncbi:MAG: hypothetical protein ACFFC7_21615 [Candidatus Hermodarchaeota archaeon]|jgi:hypothetical protein